MKNFIVGMIAVAFSVLFFSCSKTKNTVNDATSFNMEYSTEVSIPSRTVNFNAPIEVTSPEVKTLSSARFVAEGTTQALVDSISMTKFTLSNLVGNLDFVKSFSISVVADNLPDVFIAGKNSIPKGATTVAADLSSMNIKDHIFKEEVRFKVSVTINSALAADQKLKIEQSVAVKGKKIK
jgi:hypothetical protein